MNSTKNGG